MERNGASSDIVCSDFDSFLGEEFDKAAFMRDLEEKEAAQAAGKNHPHPPSRQNSLYPTFSDEANPPLVSPFSPRN
jgi:hypothetical protein